MCIRDRLYSNMDNDIEMLDTIHPIREFDPSIYYNDNEDDYIDPNEPTQSDEIDPNIYYDDNEDDLNLTY